MKLTSTKVNHHPDGKSAQGLIYGSTGQWSMRWRDVYPADYFDLMKALDLGGFILNNP